MFTGIIESLGKIVHIKKEGSNVHFTIQSPISKELKIDQSLAHNGVCLTVVAQGIDSHTVTAVEETLEKTNLGHWQVGDMVNLERAMLAGSRLDGHIVQGHVDMTGICIGREDRNGSWFFTFEYKAAPLPQESFPLQGSPVDKGSPWIGQYFVVDKGSICLNGVSLTVVAPSQNTFSVAIIPYTFEQTTFKNLQIGDTVNLEFDIIGKYLSRYFEVYRNHLS
jgi:riboflavin synthase